jgi:hypothetical protein
LAFLAASSSFRFLLEDILTFDNRGIDLTLTKLLTSNLSPVKTKELGYSFKVVDGAKSFLVFLLVKKNNQTETVCVLHPLKSILPCFLW